jgi:hypothetical protein
MPFERVTLVISTVSIDSKITINRTYTRYFSQEKTMREFIFQSIDKITSLVTKLQLHRSLAIVMLGLSILTTNIDPSLSKQDAIGKIDKMLQQDSDPNRPKTTAQWQQQARETKGKPGEKLKRIGEQSADAVKEFGSMYPEVAKNSAEELKKGLEK